VLPAFDVVSKTAQKNALHDDRVRIYSKEINLCEFGANLGHGVPDFPQIPGDLN